MNKEIEEMIQNRIEDIYQSGEYIYQAKELEEILSHMKQLEKENKNLKENKNETLRYISNYLALNQRYKLNDNVDEKLKLVKKILNGREKTITNISYEDLLKENKQLEKRNKELYEGFMATQEELTDYATKNEQLENNRDKAIEYNKNILKENWYGGYEKENAQKNIDILKGDSDE